MDSLLCIAENLLKRKCDGAQRYREFLRQVGEQSLAATEDREARQDQSDQSDQSWLVATLVGAEFGSEFNALTLDVHLRHLTVLEQSALRPTVCEGLVDRAADRSLGVPTSTLNNWKYRGLANLRHFIDSRGSPRGRPPRLGRSA